MYSIHLSHLTASLHLTKVTLQINSESQNAAAVGSRDEQLKVNRRPSTSIIQPCGLPDPNCWILVTAHTTNDGMI
jgi:hypothetical protein